MATKGLHTPILFEILATASHRGGACIFFLFSGRRLVAPIIEQVILTGKCHCAPNELGHLSIIHGELGVSEALKFGFHN